MYSKFHDYNFDNKRDIHVQKMYVKNMCFPIFSIFKWQPFCLFSHSIYHQIGLISDFLVIFNVYYFLCEHLVHTSLIDALQFTLQHLLSILNLSSDDPSVRLPTDARRNGLRVPTQTVFSDFPVFSLSDGKFYLCQFT